MSRTRTVAWVVFAVLGVAALGLWSAIGHFTFFVDHSGSHTSTTAGDLAQAGLNLDSTLPASAPVGTLVFTPDGKTLVDRLSTGAVQFRDPTTGAVLSTLRSIGLESDAESPSLAVAPDGKGIAIGINPESGGQCRVEVVSIATGKVTASVQIGGHVINSVAYSPNGQTIAIAAGTQLVLWTLASNTTISVATDQGEMQGDAYYASFSSNGARMALAGNDGVVRLWDMATMEITKTTTLTSGGGSLSSLVEAATISPDGSMVALSGGVSGSDASGNGTGAPNTWLWYPSTGKTVPLGDVTPQDGDGDEISAQAFSPDGTLLATGDDAGTIRLWNVETGKLIATRSAPSSVSPVNAIAFAPDGTSVVTAQSVTVAPGQGTAYLQFWGPKPAAGQSTPTGSASPAQPVLQPGTYPVNRQMGINGSWVLTLASVQVAASGSTTFVITVENTSTSEGELVCDDSQGSTGATITLSNKQVINATDIYCPGLPAGITLPMPSDSTLQFDTVFPNANGLAEPFSLIWDGPNGFYGSLSGVSLSR